MKLTIVHITDPHWISRNFNHTSPNARIEASEYSELSSVYSDFFETQLSAFLGDVNILAHTGDSANFYDYHQNVKIEDQFAEIASLLNERIINEQVRRKYKFDYAFAVPGNHDVERSVVPIKIEHIQHETLQCVVRAAEGWKSPCWKPSEFTRREYLVAATERQRRNATIVSNGIDSLVLSDGHSRLFSVGEEIEIIPKNRFKFFSETFNDWTTTLDFDSALIRHKGINVRLALFNSAINCGRGVDQSGARLELVEVPSDNLAKWRRVANKSHEDTFRIALLHHNPLPNHLLRSLSRQDDLFLNSGPFNRNMIETDVKLVLSGHQHFGDEIYYAKPDSDNVEGWASPLIESGFLSANAPTFLRTKEGQAGFNIIQVTLNPNDNIARVTLNKLTFVSKNPVLHLQTTKYILAVRRLQALHANKGELERRRSLLQRSVGFAYSREPMEPLERVLHILTVEPVVRTVVEQEQELARLSSNNLFGVYVASVLPPDTWWANQLTRLYRNTFQLHWTKVINVSTEEELLFESSASVNLALVTSIENARESGVCNKVATANTEKWMYEDLNWVNEIKKDCEDILLLPSISRFCSLSVSSPAMSIATSSKRRRRIKLVQPVADILLEYGSENPAPTSGLEIARILLWPITHFRSSYARSIIDFHEDFCVPLFWLAPNRLKTRRGEYRKHIGSHTHCAHYNALFDEKCDSPVSHISNAILQSPLSDDYYKTSDARDLKLMEKIWNVKGYPKVLEPVSWSPMAEFKALLNRPDIMLAADVYALVISDGGHAAERSGEDEMPQALKEFFSRRDAECDQWLHSSTNRVDKRNV